MDFASQLKRQASRVEDGIDRLLPARSAPPARLHAAMRYSLQAGGKRLRPVLLLAAAEAFAGRGRADPLAAAVALECLHTYSLIHDDLPCMDDDDLRRGRPTAHKAFDEATALLAGDALLTEAFALLGRHYARRPALAASLLVELGDAAGSRRMIGGQMADLLAEGRRSHSAEQVAFIHRNKTAAVIEAALVMGGLVGGGSKAQLAALRRAGRHLGMAYQIIDDILDVTQTSAGLGKTAGKDTRAGKATWVSVHGLERAKRDARRQSMAAIRELRRLPGGRGFLVGLAGRMAERES